MSVRHYIAQCPQSNEWIRFCLFFVFCVFVFMHRCTEYGEEEDVNRMMSNVKKYRDNVRRPQKGEIHSFYRAISRLLSAMLFTVRLNTYNLLKRDHLTGQSVMCVDICFCLLMLRRENRYAIGNKKKRKRRTQLTNLHSF